MHQDRQKAMFFCVVALLTLISSSFCLADQDVCRDAKVVKEGGLEFVTGTKSKTDRLAVVWGEESYSKDVGILKNAGNDARRIARNLVDLGFGVLCLIDPKADQIATSVREVSSKAHDGTKVFVYYAGHGAKIAGTDYILPITIEREMTSEDLQQYAISVNYIMQVLSRHPHTWTVFVLDACRKEIGIWNATSRSINETVGGFGTASGSDDLWLVYSAYPNNLANDGDETTKAGLFMSIFSNKMMEKGSRLFNIIGDTRKDMKKVSGKGAFPFKQEAYLTSFSDAGSLILSEAETPEEKAEVMFRLAVESKQSTKDCNYLNEFYRVYGELGKSSSKIKMLIDKANEELKDCTNLTSASSNAASSEVSGITYLETPTQTTESWTSQTEMHVSLRQQSLHGKIGQVFQASQGIPVTGDGVRIRAKPTIDSPAIGIVYKNSRVMAKCASTESCEDGWYSVSTPTGSGYLNASFVTEAEIKESKRIEIDTVERPLEPDAYAQLRGIATNTKTNKGKIRLSIINPATDDAPQRAKANALYLGMQTVADLTALGVDGNRITVEYAAPIVSDTVLKPYIQVDVFQDPAAKAPLQ
jgi:hypothetical protein